MSSSPDDISSSYNHNSDYGHHSQHGGDGTSTTTPMEILSILFFMVAGIWLIAALVYSCLVLVFLRLRRQGQLGSDDIHDERYGRVYLCGSTHVYIPLGWLFRRYARHLDLDHNYNDGAQHAAAAAYRYMSLEERRDAMKALLRMDRKEQQQQLQTLDAEADDDDDDDSDDDEPPPPPGAVDDVEAGAGAGTVESVDLDDDDDDDICASSSTNEPICSICLGELLHEEKGTKKNHGPTDGATVAIFQPTTCRHQFHTPCILDWLQRRNNTECPCCRKSMVKEEQVWKQVKKIRKEKRARRRKQQQKNKNNEQKSEQQRQRQQRRQQILSGSDEEEEISETEQCDNDVDVDLDDDDDDQEYQYQQEEV